MTPVIKEDQGIGTLQTRSSKSRLIIIAIIMAFSQSSYASEKGITFNTLRNPYFGDIHVHTSFDIDSRMGGNTNDPDDAYRFAKGETALPIAQAATPTPNVTLKISRPLDFAAVTDHAEMMADTLCLDTKYAKKYPDIYFSKSCKGIRTYDVTSLYGEEKELLRPKPHPASDICPPVKESPEKINPICVEAAKNRWLEIQRIANKHYEKGTFTTFISYEHTPTTSTEGAFHRNVIFRGSSVPAVPLSAYSIFTASGLWKKLDETCNDKNDCQALTIPHMINVSNGMFFAKEDRQNSKSTPTPYTLEDYERRKRLEPLIEIHQTKGNSECLMGVGTTDEFCQFESLITRPCDKFDQKNYPDVDCRKDSYVRNGLKKGLVLAGEAAFGGLNPFKYGFIGGTDIQHGTPGAVEEYQFISEGGVDGTSPKGRLTQQPKKLGKAPLRFLNPGGLTGVWAEENSREAIFDALKRKEVFATSGTRIAVRLFASWDYPKNLHQSSKKIMLQQAYQNGTPMGGDIYQEGQTGKKEQAPRFLVLAAKDPLGANLQRLQIIKGWEDTDGTHEQTYDVVCSDGLEPNKNHRCPDNGAKVNLKNCSYSKLRGADELKITWSDPDFDPSRRAFYYARVLENPTCRWSTYDANIIDMAPMEDIPATIQERAWSSPIWYTPSANIVNEK